MAYEKRDVVAGVAASGHLLESFVLAPLENSLLPSRGARLFHRRCYAREIAIVAEVQGELLARLR